MSEENTEEVQETDEGTEVTEDSQELTIDDYKRMLSQTRKEAAKYRVQKNERDAELKEYEAWKDSQKTELERAQDKVKELEEKVRKNDLTQLQRKAAEKAGLDPDAADRIRGDNYDDMLADAKAMAQLFGRADAEEESGNTTARDFFGGVAGKKPVGQTKSEQQWFEDLLNG